MVGDWMLGELVILHRSSYVSRAWMVVVVCVDATVPIGFCLYKEYLSRYV